MKRIAHLLYIGVILFLCVMFVLKKTRCPGCPKGSISYEEAEQIQWTYGVDYNGLIPLETITKNDPELRAFIQELETVFKNKEWMKVIELSNEGHYAEQGGFLENDTLYIYNNLSIYSTYSQGVIVRNRISESPKASFDELDQLKELRIIGVDPDRGWETADAFFGYVEKENGVILAIQLMITKRDGEYELTGGVG